MDLTSLLSPRRGTGLQTDDTIRANAWTVLEQLLAIYADSRKKADTRKAGKIETTVREYPFAGVLAALLRIAAGQDADLLVAGECLQALQRCPEVRDWI